MPLCPPSRLVRHWDRPDFVDTLMLWGAGEILDAKVTSSVPFTASAFIWMTRLSFNIARTTVHARSWPIWCVWKTPLENAFPWTSQIVIPSSDEMHERK